MLLEARRTEAHLGYTLGALYLDGYFFGWTLEDQLRPAGVKIPGATAIPAGTYRVIIDQSVRFKCLMPHVLDVPGFDGIRIHAGNSPEDTTGCLLVGMAKGKIGEGRIYRSREAFDLLFAEMKTAIGEGQDVTLTISNEFGAGSPMDPG